MASPVAVTGRLTTTDGVAVQGAVRFQLSWDCWLADNTATVIQAKPIDVATAADGTFSVELYKNADLKPDNSSYTVTEHFGPAVEAQYTIVVVGAGAIGSNNVPITASPALSAQYVITSISDGVDGGAAASVYLFSQSIMGGGA